jgi:hypothetical protein
MKIPTKKTTLNIKNRDNFLSIFIIISEKKNRGSLIFNKKLILKTGSTQCWNSYCRCGGFKASYDDDF